MILGSFKEEFLIMKNHIFKILADTGPAEQHKFLFGLFSFYHGDNVVVVKPVFTLKALHHEGVLILYLVRLFAVAIGVEESLVVEISRIFIFIFFVVELA